MAKLLFVTEYAGMLNGLPQEPPLAEQTVDFTSAVGRVPNAFSKSTNVVRLEADTACCAKVGSSDVTATTASGRIAANAKGEFRAVNPGQFISAIAAP